MSIQLFYLLLALFPLASFGQIKITGQILDTNDNPIAYATVTLLSSENEIIKRALSNETGNFNIELNTGGDFQPQITYLENILFEKEIALLESIEMGTLITDNSILLDGVNITAKILPKIKKELGKFSIQNPSNSPFALNKSTIEFLRFVPILNIESTNEISILNKGLATIYFNGRKIEDTSVATNLLRSIPAEDIKTIEIITNPDSRFDATSGSGIINIITKKAENEGIKGAISASTSQSYLNSQDFNSYLSYSRKKIAATAAFSYYNSNYFTSSNNVYDDLSEELQTLIESRSSSSNKIFTGNLNFDYNLSKNQNIGFQFFTKVNAIEGTSSNKKQYNQLNSTAIDSTYTTNISSVSPNNLTTFKANINYQLKTDAIGSHLDVDLIHYNNENNTETQNIFNNTSEFF